MSEVFSGDCLFWKMCDIILKKFENHEIEFLYHEITTDGYKAHTSLELLKQKIKIEDRNRVTCMHFNDSTNINEIEEIGFRRVRWMN